ncbi:hypothetical protein [Terriglobus roseus]|uniref:Uncharacterized protein n=1 Tax=Terriglobus roseus TaxID=392734 RepID=A0A1G7Q191_9BACT|nr:hypothetical protein [Terriglobus roseus]SDF92251.1 hypothetical protein SAMN05444167_3705 [Terriglobus roseus]
MAKIEVVVFLTCEELTGKAVVEADFIASLRRFSRDSILRLCSFIALVLETYKRGSKTENVQASLLYDFFPPKVAAEFVCLLWASSERRRLLFHRRQLLLLAKYAVTHCPSNGMNAVGNMLFGVLLIQANDLLDNPTPMTSTVLSSREDMAAFITTMVSAGEYAHRMPAQTFARSRKLLVDIPKKLFPTLDLNCQFESVTGLSLELYLGLSVTALAKFFRYQDSDWLKHADEATLLANNLIVEGSSARDVNILLNIIAASPSKLKALYAGRTARKNDSTMFRDFPFVESVANFGLINQTQVFLPIDLEFMMDKLLGGPFWTLKATVPQFESLYWGKIFEAYTQDILTRASSGTNQSVYCNPVYADNPLEEICDVLILCGETVVLLETKTCMLDASSKYEGKPELLLAKLEKLLVGSPEKPKAVRQLAKAVRNLFQEGNQRLAKDIDLSQVKSCFCSTVTLDYIGGAAGVATLLSSFMDEILDSEKLRVQFEGHYTTNIDELETMTGFLKSTNIGGLLNLWKIQNPALGRPFGAQDIQCLKWEYPQWLEQDFRSIFDKALRHVLPKQYEKRGLSLPENQPMLKS